MRYCSVISCGLSWKGITARGKNNFNWDNYGQMDFSFALIAPFLKDDCMSESCKPRTHIPADCN